MSRLRTTTLAAVLAVTMAGGAIAPTPAYANLPTRFCTQLAAAIEFLQGLAARYPDNPLIKLLLARAMAAQDAFCSTTSTE
jgi:hypothetical protein